MKDIRTSNLKINARNEISFKVLAKPWDYSLVELELLKNCEINWDMLDIEITWLVNWDTEKLRKEKLVKLNWLIDIFCKKSWNDMQAEIVTLYLRNRVQSRTELTDSQLDEEIKTYKTGLLEFN